MNKENIIRGARYSLVSDITWVKTDTIKKFFQKHKKDILDEVDTFYYIFYNLSLKHIRGEGGIYYIKNIENNKIYYGSTANLCERIKNHIYLLKSRKHNNANLQEDYNKYTITSFRFGIIKNYWKILFDSVAMEELRREEVFYIKNSLHTYNIKNI